MIILFLFSCQNKKEKFGTGKVHYGVIKAEAPYVTGPIEIDGDFKEWQNFITTAVTKKNNLEVGNVSNDKDLKGVFCFAWDEEHLYFAAKVNDNQIVRDKEKSGIWKDDCIELFIDPKYDGLVWGNQEDFQIGLAPSDGKKAAEVWAWFQNMHPGENIRMSSLKTEDGYNIEAAIKWGFLNVKPVNRMQICVSPAFHDSDTLDDTPNGKINWYYAKDMLWGGIKLGKLVLVQKQGEKEVKIIKKEKESEVITHQEYYEEIPVDRAGCYPMWLSKKQAYWTTIGVEDDYNEAIFNEDGSIEPHKRGFSVMPFLYIDNKLITRNESEVTQSLEKGFLPIPSVKWNYKDVTLEIKLFVDGENRKSVANLRYTVQNNSKKNISGKLFLAVQPFQIFPPWQNGGGVSKIHSIQYKNGVIEINKKDKIFLLTEPNNFGVRDGIFKRGSLAQQDIISEIKKGKVPSEKSVEEPNGFASGAAEYDFELKVGEKKEYIALMPLYNIQPKLNINLTDQEISQEFENKLNKSITHWESKLDEIEIDIPETEIVNTLKANLLYNLITKDGAGFQPGSRSYDKVWMRDGAIQANSLLQMGFTKEIKDFVEWYSKYQFETGEIPPIIDTKADDHLWEEKEQGLIEYDSQGEFIWIILQYYHFSKDKEFLKKMLPYIINDLKFTESLRAQKLTDEYKNGTIEKKRFYGILPPSTSHEGYASAHSYWDDFWALKGWKDAKKIAEILDREDLIKWIDEEYNDFKKCFYDSMGLVMKYKKINFIPGCADLGDFDATSTAIAIIYCDELDNLPEKQLKNTFDRYYKEIKTRFKKGAKYRLTPYEVRNIPAFIYMDQKERALKLLKFMLMCCRPSEWHQLAEVVNSDYRFPGYFGDMPHTWVGGEYINAVRSMFVYEKNDKLILGHGIDEKWLEREEGIHVNLPTYYGKINYTVKKLDKSLKINISGNAEPEKGFIFKSPFLKKKIKKVTINGKEWKEFSKNEVIFNELPVDIVIY